MQNLAGHEEADSYIKDELTRAGITVVQNSAKSGEVVTQYKGELNTKYGKFSFKRAWYFWIVDGPVPQDIAERLYEHPEGKKNVRVGGHYGCPHPTEYGAERFDQETGKKVISIEEYTKFIEWFRQMGDKASISDLEQKYVIKEDEKSCPYRVHSYHIDSQAGLLLFVLMLTDQLKGE